MHDDWYNEEATLRTLQLLTILAACILLANACDNPLTTATKTRAKWQYVKEARGGVVIGEPSVGATHIQLPLTLDFENAVHRDSAICTCGVFAEIDGERLRIAVKRCICGEVAGQPLIARFKRPAAGTYSIVYDDAEANFPELGELTVP